MNLTFATLLYKKLNNDIRYFDRKYIQHLKFEQKKIPLIVHRFALIS